MRGRGGLSVVPRLHNERRGIIVPGDRSDRGRLASGVFTSVQISTQRARQLGRMVASSPLRFPKLRPFNPPVRPDGESGQEEEETEAEIGRRDRCRGRDRRPDEITNVRIFDLSTVECV